MSVDRPSKAERIEQALAFGRSYQWMRVNLGATDRDIAAAVRRMDDAATPDPEESESGDNPYACHACGQPLEVAFAPAPRHVIRALIDELFPPRPPAHPERDARIAALTAEGLTVREIAAQVGLSQSGVSRVQSRDRIRARRRSAA